MKIILSSQATQKQVVGQFADSYSREITLHKNIKKKVATPPPKQQLDITENIDTCVQINT